MALGAFAPLLYWQRDNGFVMAFLAGAALLVLFGFLDDLYDLPPRVKLLGQIAAALIVMIWGGVQVRWLGSLLPDGMMLPPLVAIPLTLLAIVGATNAINLSDGLDGLAGGLCLMIFAAIGCLAYLTQNQAIGLVALALMGVLFGFLRFNTHPATVFMGDAGSQFLGYAAATLAIALTQTAQTLSPVLPLLLLGFPILDTATVMTTRIVRKRSPFSADKNHFHHHLLSLGLPQEESVLVIYLLQFLLIGAAALLRYYSDWLLLLGYLAFSVTFLVLFQRVKQEEWRPRSITPPRFAAWLRLVKREGWLIRGVFPVFELGIPGLLILTCLMAGPPPFHVKFAALAMAGVIMVAGVWKKNLFALVVRIALYLLIPYAVYLKDNEPLFWAPPMLESGFTALFVLFAVMILLISKFSRRRDGFKSSPMDFLVILLALAIPRFSAWAPVTTGWDLWRPR